MWEEKDQQVNREGVSQQQTWKGTECRGCAGLVACSLKSGLWVDNPELMATGAESTPLVQEVVLQADHTAGGPRPHLSPRELSA